MRVLAAQFEDREIASRVLERLRARFELGPDDAQIAPLGVGSGARAAATLLAGRFREGRVDEIRALVEAEGGTVIADIDEGWTKPARREGPPLVAPPEYSGPERRRQDRRQTRIVHTPPRTA